MKRNTYRHITRILRHTFLGASLALLGACGMMQEPESNACGSAGDDISVSFRLFTGNPTATRAADEYGTVAENYIDMANLKILVFDENETLKQVLYDNGKMPDKTSISEAGQGMYVLKTMLDPDMYDFKSNFAVVVLANWENTNAKMTTTWPDASIVGEDGRLVEDNVIGTLKISDLRNYTFTLNPQVAAGSEQPDSWMPGKESGWIPMFGSRYMSLSGYDNKVFNEANPMPCPEILLVRALTKIEVINNDLSEKAPEIESITLTRRNQFGRLMQNYVFTGYSDNVTVPTIPYPTGGKPTTSPIPFHKNRNVYTVYVPEMYFDTTMDRQAICLTLKRNNSLFLKWIYLAPYSNVDGLPIFDSNNFNGNSDWDNLKRNYWYQYEINSLDTDFEVEVNVTPYTEIIIDPMFGLGDLIVKPPKPREE